MKLKLTLLIFLFITEINGFTQIIYDLQDDLLEYSMINALNNGGQLDDEIVMSNPPIIQADLNSNGQLDYITSYPAIDEVYIYFDQPDFTDNLYIPHNGPNLIISGSDYFGSSFTVGDFNGDNKDDLLIGAKAVSGDGEAYIIYGNSTLPTTGNITISDIKNITVSFAGWSGEPDTFGEQVCAADLNNDGFDEIIVSAPGYTPMSNKGSIFIINGSSSLPSIIEATTDSDIIIEGGDVFDHIGRYLRKGDFNDDNYEDLVFTSPHWPGAGSAGQRGKAWILFGSNNLLDYFNIGQTYSEITGFAGKNMSDEMAFAAVGDINGDEVDDLILSSVKYDAPIIYPSSNNFGTVYVNYGPISPGEDYLNVEDFPNQTQIFPNQEDIGILNTYMFIGSRFGQSISTMDINNDGNDDLLIGAPGYSRLPPTGSQTNEGGAFIILGSSSLGDVIYEDSQYARFLADIDVNGQFGRAVSFLNINQDNKIYASIADLQTHLIYLFNLDVTTEIEFTEKPVISLFPVPTKDILNIRTEIAGYYHITLSNILGQEILSKETISIKNITIDISDFDSGIYIIKLIDSKSKLNVYKTKFIKQ